MAPAKSRNVQELATGSLGRLLFKYSWPALVSMSLNALYTVVDRFYIGHGCGEAAIAGLTLVFPLMMLFGAFGVFVGVGHCTLISIKLGEHDQTACEKLLGELVCVKLLFAVLIPPLVFIFADPILRLVGGAKVSPETLACARDYLRVVVLVQVYAHLAFGLSAAMRAEGDATRSMCAMIVGFGANLILDPIFIFYFDMGIVGAAWATNIAMFLSCLFALQHYIRGKSAIRLDWHRFRIYREFIGRASAVGFAPFLQQLLGALINVSLSVAFAKWAVDAQSATTQIASLGVFQSLLIMTLMPVLGTQQGIQPIIGYNWGARNFRRVKDALVLGLVATTVLCIIATVVQVVPPFPKILASLFVSSDNASLLDIAARDLQISNCMLWCIGLNIVATTYFQSIGHPKMAVILSTMRQGFIMLPIIWLLPYLMEDKTLAIWLCMPVSDVLCCVATALPFYLNVRFLSRVRERKTLVAKAE